MVMVKKTSIMERPIFVLHFFFCAILADGHVVQDLCFLPFSLELLLTLYLPPSVPCGR